MPVDTLASSRRRNQNVWWCTQPPAPYPSYCRIFVYRFHILQQAHCGDWFTWVFPLSWEWLSGALWLLPSKRLEVKQDLNALTFNVRCYLKVLPSGLKRLGPTNTPHRFCSGTRMQHQFKRRNGARSTPNNLPPPCFDHSYTEHSRISLLCIIC